MKTQHHYALTIHWTGNQGQGTRTYRGYARSHTIQSAGKPKIDASSDPAFRGDKSRYNPEELLVAALSSCHMLWYLHLSSEAGVVVTDYVDQATGTMVETADGGGHFTEVTLHPLVTLRDPSMLEKAKSLHQRANELCFIAGSVNFPVRHDGTYQFEG